MLKNFLVLLILPFVFFACKENSLNLKIRFNQVQGLKQGNRVIFGQNHIGTVKNLLYSDEEFFIVDIAIKKDFADDATEHSRFFIITDSQHKENKAVEMIQIRDGGTLLKNNATIEGSTETSILFQKLFGGIENGLKDLEKQFEQFSKDLKNIPETEEFKKLENELQRLAEEMKRSGQAVRQKIKEELLPQLKKEMEKLRKRLYEFGREDEMKPLEIEMEKIQKI
ncbi:MAG: MlaD family protein [Thermodesulfobacteriota bacterium]|nr:MlaD family protein [Thermodesulfobacteriota bacterium]